MATHFGSLPYNFYQSITSGAENAIDGNRNTYTSISTLAMPLGTVRNTPSAVAFNAMYLSCQGVTGYTLTNMGGTQITSSSTAPKTINGTGPMPGDRQYTLVTFNSQSDHCLLYTSPSPRD